MTSDALKPPSQRHIDNARERAEYIMTLDDTTEWIEFLASLDLPFLVIVVTLIIVAGGVAKAWIRKR